MVAALLAHPDDELMCAGTLAKFRDQGEQVALITAFSDRERTVALHEAAEILDVELIERFSSEWRFGWTQEAVRYYDAIVSDLAPTHLIGHRKADGNTSHVPLAMVLRTIARKNRVALWEIDAALPGALEPEAPAPNLLVGIDAQAERKYRAVERYRSVGAANPGWRRAIWRRDLYNGWLLNMAEEEHFAEAFRIHKSVWP
jgi:LmbE family N-acetylglucosaminyl deacetylase